MLSKLTLKIIYQIMQMKSVRCISLLLYLSIQSFDVSQAHQARQPLFLITHLKKVMRWPMEKVNFKETIV